jgi:DNA polymerase I-like protein with 3'-5' exonuclease and polymerase domains
MIFLKGLFVIDFETYYDADYSLSKLTTEEYIRNPLFEVIGVSVIDTATFTKKWLTHVQFAEFCAANSFERAAILCHHTAFDGAILSWIYGVNPNMWLDTLSMARAINNQEKSNSLAMLAKQFGLGEKGTEVIAAKGKHFADFTPEEYRQYGVYSINDSELTFALFKVLYNILGKPFPVDELRLIDLTLRMFIEPRIVLNKELLQAAYWDEVKALEALLARLNIAEKDLASNPKFAAILETLGVTIPYKKNSKGEFIYAFAKTDVGFQSLAESEDETIALLCEARLKAKSTLMRTRSQRLYNIATRGALPVPLQYYGAHTGRMQATRGQAINMQNLTRGSKLRHAITAPKGMVFVVGDLKQIEVRVLAMVANFAALLVTLADDDPYATFGADMFSTPGMTKETHPDLRQAAKSALLGCGYGLGYLAFAAKLLAGFMGAPPVRYGVQFAVQMGYDIFDIQEFAANDDIREKVLTVSHACTEGELLVHAFVTQKIVDKYRSTSLPVTDLWGKCNNIIKYMRSKQTVDFLDILKVNYESLWLPNGLRLYYPDLHLQEKDGKQNWCYGKNFTKLYGGKLTENIVQALARIIMTDAMLRIKSELPIVLSVHDEIVALAPENDAEAALKWMHSMMTIPPLWMPAIPLAVDGGYGKIYGEIK